MNPISVFGKTPFGSAKSLLIAVTVAFSTGAIADEFDLSINGVKVPRAQMEAMYKEGLKVEKDPAKLKQMIRQDTIKREVLAQQALKDKLDKDSEFKLRQEIQERYALANAYMTKATKDTVTDADAKKEYDKVVKETGNKAEYQVRHILVEKEDKAKELAKVLKSNPKKFAELAGKESKDPGSAKNGGSLGWVGMGALVPEFEATMSKLKKGQISEPVKTQYGYHLILVDDTRTSTPPKFEEVKDRIKQQMARDRADGVINSLVQKAKVE